MRKWLYMTEEEKAEILAELREKWPSMRNDHPRQEGLPHYNSWKKLDLKNFLRSMDYSLLYSWLEYEKQYEELRFQEYREDINQFLDSGYREKHPYSAEIISRMVNTPKMNFEKTQKFVYDMLNTFRPNRWPIRRGRSEEYYTLERGDEEE